MHRREAVVPVPAAARPGLKRRRHRYPSRTVAAQRQFEGQFQALARRSFDAAFECAVQEEGAVVSAALAATLRSLLGRSDDARAQGAWEACVHPEDHPVVAAHLLCVLAGQRHLAVFRGVTPAGEVRWLSLLSRPVWDAGGRRVAHVYGLLKDHPTRGEVCQQRRAWLREALSATASPRSSILR